MHQADETSPLFSLVSGEGDGFMLGLAAGDTAGGAWELGYSALTEQATVISYELIAHRKLAQVSLVDSMREMDGSQGGEQVFRAESPAFRSWLDSATSGSVVPTRDPTAENLVRSAPVGAAFRHDSEAVVENSIRLSRMFSFDAGSIMAGLVGASAVAAGAFGQSGRDFASGVAEAVLGAAGQVANDTSASGRLDTLEQELHDCIERVGIPVDDEPRPMDGPGDPLTTAITGLRLAAPMWGTPHLAIEKAARIGGSLLGAFVGAVVGARVGIRAWPWPFANDTWFAEIGRRVVRGPDEIRDLPIPYAVEQHLMSGTPRGFH